MSVESFVIHFKNSRLKKGIGNSFLSIVNHLLHRCFN